MSIARAVHEIELADGQPPSRHMVFRAQQRELDRLIGEAEGLVMSNSMPAPPLFVEKARRALTQIPGGAPSWLTPSVSPVALLNHLLVAEGRLRRKYYRAVVLDLDDED